MDADLEDLHPSVREGMLKDEEYLKTQKPEVIRYYLEQDDLED